VSQGKRYILEGMEIESTLTNRAGQVLKVVYREGNPLKDLEGKILQAIHAFCFCGGKLVVIYQAEKGYWAVPGGGIEEGETYEEALVREVKEESNMKVLRQELIGYIDIYENTRIIRQTRSLCIVEPYGDFVSDPAGDVTEIKLIDPADYKQYFDWGEIGDRIMERAGEMKSELD
jgi:ADP-ribose pyrophosphatase YjhB (NUDIX family)